MNFATERRYLDTKAIANYTGLSPQTMAKFRCLGGGPPYSKIGKKVIYRVDDVDRWVNARRRANTSAPLAGEAASEP